MRAHPRRPEVTKRTKKIEERSKQRKPEELPDSIVAYDDLTLEILTAITQNVMAKASRAREDIFEFFEFVMKDFTGKPIKLAPHQRVGLEFMMAHGRSVNMWPVGTSKTFIAVGLTLFFMGRDPTIRGAVVSATEEQAKKIVALVRGYIEGSTELHLVFPALRQSTREGDQWTQTSLTIERPRGIKDASLTAYGVDSPRIIGTRLNWVVLDDLLNDENTSTQELRTKLVMSLDQAILSRVDAVGESNDRWSKVVMINTPWHPKDVVHHARDEYGWACMRMDCLGDIEVWDDRRCFERFLEGSTGIRIPNPMFGKTWDSELLRPADPLDSSSRLCRLIAHDPDPHNNNLLWPEVQGWTWIEQQRSEKLPVVFNQLHRCLARDDATSMCKQSYIDKCLKVARDLGIFSFVSEYKGPNLTFTGVDLAISEGEEHDETAFFTFEARPGGLNVILDIESGQWDGPTIIDKLFQKQAAYNSIVRVENNGCFVPGTRVLTRERGYVAIEDVKVGEHTWTHAHRWRPIKEVLNNTAEGVHKARAAGGLPVEATANHWFHLREAARTSGRGNGHVRPFGEPEWISAGFVNKPSYVHVAVPQWPDCIPELMGKPLSEDDALVLGLYMAEGNSTTRQANWTLNRYETHLAEAIEEFAHRIVPCAKVTRFFREGALRVIVNSTKLATALRPIGKSRDKCLPLEWMGAPIEWRMAAVRGWLLGDGCVLENNSKTDWPSKFFKASSISRNWIMWVRSTLLSAGYRATVNPVAARESFIGQRKLHGGPAFGLALNSEDSYRLRSEMTSDAETFHWPPLRWSGRLANSQTIIDESGVWSRLRNAPGCVRAHRSDVYNLVVEEDESFTVEDMIVHNAQQYIVQFALRRNLSIPIKAHTTEKFAKANPTTGVPGLFVELSNGAWAFPNNMRGEKQAQMSKFIEDCLFYTPKKHCADRLMACVVPGALVTTKRGMVSIEDVVQGDEVLTHRSRWRKVTGVTEHEHAGEVRLIKPTGCSPFSITPEHPVWSSTARFERENRTNRIIPRGDWMFRPCQEIRVGSLETGHFLSMPFVSGNDGESFEWDGIEFDYDASMLLGLYLAEGSIGNHQHSVMFSLHRRENHLAGFCNAQMQRLFNCNGAAFRQGSGENGMNVILGSARAARLLAQCGSRSRKCLPWDVWHRIPSSLQLAVVRGWLMGDGCYNVTKGAGRLSGVSISSDLLQQMRSCLFSHGFIPTLNAFMHEGPRMMFGNAMSWCQNSWKIQLTQMDTRVFLKEASVLEVQHWQTQGTDEARLGVTDRTNSRLLWRDTGVLTRATSIELREYHGLVHNLHVEEDESYCVEGIAVHNCYFAREQKRQFVGLTGDPGVAGDKGSPGATIMSR